MAKRKRKHPISKGAKPQGEWIRLEHRDAEGNPTLPKRLMASTHNRQHVSTSKLLVGRVLADYRPPILMVQADPLIGDQAKIYEIDQITIEGWRRRGRIKIHIAAYRGHEEHWFSAMKNMRVNINQPEDRELGPDEYNYVAHNTEFAKTIYSVTDKEGNGKEEHLYVGTIGVTENWASVLRRNKMWVLKSGAQKFLIPVLIGLTVALVSLLLFA